MPSAAKLARVADLRQMVLDLARVRIRERYGDIPEHEVRLRLDGIRMSRATD